MKIKSIFNMTAIDSLLYMGIIAFWLIVSSSFRYRKLPWNLPPVVKNIFIFKFMMLFTVYFSLDLAFDLFGNAYKLPSYLPLVVTVVADYIAEFIFFRYSKSLNISVNKEGFAFDLGKAFIYFMVLMVPLSLLFISFFIINFILFFTSQI